MAPSLHTLHVVLLLTTLILLLLTTQRVFAHTTKLRVSRRNIDGHKCQSHQEDHKSLSLQHDDEGHKCHSQQFIAQHISTYLHAIIIASFGQCVSAITRLRTSQQDLPHSQQEHFKSLALRPLLHLQATIFFLMTSIHNLLALVITYLGNSKIRQPHTKLDHRMTISHHDEQSATSSTVVSVKMRPPMHWIYHPRVYSMMQHQSRTALYHESAQANTYVSTPNFTHPHHEQQLTSSQGLSRLA
jgi:hypothetical protein